MSKLLQKLKLLVIKKREESHLYDKHYSVKVLTSHLGQLTALMLQELQRFHNWKCNSTKKYIKWAFKKSFYAFYYANNATFDQWL